MAPLCVWHGSFARDITPSHVRHDSSVCMMWRIHICDRTYSHVWHDNFICVTWLMHMRDIHECYSSLEALESALKTHWQLCHKNMAGPFSSEVSCSKCRCTSLFARPTSNHSGAICAWELHCFLVPTVTVAWESVGSTWLNHIRVTWLTERIHIFPRFEVLVWHDLFICVWFDCHNASTCDMTRSDLYPAIATMPFKSVRLRPRGRDSKRKSQLAEFTICLVINSVISLHLLLRKDKALRMFCLYMYNWYVSRVTWHLQFLVEKLQCVHVMATICFMNTH